MARQKSSLTKGQFLLYLFDHVDQDTANDVFYRKSGQPGHKKYVSLNQPRADFVLSKIEQPIYQMFRNSVTDAPELLTEKDKKFLAYLKNIDHEQRTRVRQIIRGLSEPWWVKYVDDPDRSSAAERLRELIRRRIPAGGTVQQKAEKYPYIDKQKPLSTLCVVQTDDIPFLAKELDCSIQFLMDLSTNNCFYTDDPEVDNIFNEYKLLDQQRRDIIFVVLEQVNDKNS